MMSTSPLRKKGLAIFHAAPHLSILSKRLVIVKPPPLKLLPWDKPLIPQLSKMHLER
jgi:hypothetical protein